MSTNKRWSIKNLFTAQGGCGCKPKETSDDDDNVIEPKLKSKTSSDQTKHSHYPSPNTDNNSAQFRPINYDHTDSSNTDNNSPQFRPINYDHTKWIDSLVVVKESEDPYRDFKHSMLQMIFEKEIYSRNDLHQLVQCFLDLNSPLHHQIILQAFMEIWNAMDGVVADETTPCSSPLHFGLAS